jgi:hypothetical protein
MVGRRDARRSQGGRNGRIDERLRRGCGLAHSGKKGGVSDLHEVGREVGNEETPAPQRFVLPVLPVLPKINIESLSTLSGGVAAVRFMLDHTKRVGQVGRSDKTLIYGHFLHPNLLAEVGRGREGLPQVSARRARAGTRAFALFYYNFADLRIS